MTRSAGSCALLVACALAAAIFASPASAAIGYHGTSSMTYASESTTSLELSAPAGAQSGDLLIASLGFGVTGAGAQPTVSAPPGWALVSRTNMGTIATLVVYRHAFAAGESSYTWTTNVSVGGNAFLTAFSGVDTSNPIDASAGQTATSANAITTPSVATTSVGAVLV